MKKTRIIYLAWSLSCVLSQSITASSTKKYHEEINDLNHEPVSKKQKTNHLEIEDLLEKLSTKLFLNEYDYQFVEEKDVKNFGTTLFDENIYYSFLLIGYQYKKIKEIPSIIFDKIKQTEIQNNFDCHVKFNLGALYHLGKGVDQDDKKAITWYQQAADQRHVQAQYLLGFMYGKRQEVGQNYQKVLQCYEKAAEQGHASAQYNLGIMYDEGQGVEQNHQKAFQYYEKAAEQGDSFAQNRLVHKIDLV